MQKARSCSAETSRFCDLRIKPELQFPSAAPLKADAADVGSDEVRFAYVPPGLSKHLLCSYLIIIKKEVIILEPMMAVLPLTGSEPPYVTLEAFFLCGDEWKRVHTCVK